MILNEQILVDAQNSSPLEGLGLEVNENQNAKRFLYDASVMSTGVGAVQLVDDQGNPAVLPVGSIIKRTFVDVVVAVASAGAATVAVGCTTAVDILAATAKASLGVGLVEGTAAGPAADMTKVLTGTTVLQRNDFSVPAQPVVATIGTAALTAGKFYVHVEFCRSSLT
jgi:hypothetical protein